MNKFVHNRSIESDLAMAKRVRMMTTEDVLDELQLVEDNNNFDEPMMPGSDDEFEDVYLEDLEDDDEDDCYFPLPSDISGSSSHTPTPRDAPDSSSHTPTPSGAPGSR